MLSQGPKERDLPIAYYSRTLNKAEQNYDVATKELLSIVSSVKHFRPYLLGRKFIIKTDHSALQYLNSVKDPSSRLLRWRLVLEEYDYVIEYKPGRVNKNADFLSRIRFVETPLNINTTSVDDYEQFLKTMETSVISYSKFHDFNENLVSAKHNVAFFFV